MARKRKFADGGVMGGAEAKRRGADAGKSAATTSFGKLLDRKIGEADKLTARMKVLREKGPEALADTDRAERSLSDTAKAEREKLTDSMGAYKKGGAVRGDGKAVRGRTKGRFV